VTDTYDPKRDDNSRADNDDVRHDDLEFNPSLEPTKAKAWLNLLEESEDAFEDWNDHCDKIDEKYASLKRLSEMSREKEFQMFWANAEVIKPAIYAKPPIPVVVPKFMDRRPVYQAAAEVMERCAVVAFDLAYIDELMKLVRDDLALADRGVAWCRYESGKDSYYDHEKVCIDFKNRRDFLHSVSRNWREVTWVAGASYLTRSEARERFQPISGDEYQNAEYRVDKDTQRIGGADNRERAKFWEIWSRGDRRVVWVAKGCEFILDEDDPHLDLRGFFPCPKPAYGTVQRGSLVPVPDVLQYRDQLDEINLLTSRIHALSEALEAKGFYPAGGAELADAIQAAIKAKTPGRVLVPISNWAAFGGSKEVIIWLPIDMIAQTITGLVALRKEIIQDIYQVMGLSDIMRGSTNPEETLGAQQLKSEYGSSRIRDKQQELVRLARDLVEITCEIITEKFSKKTIIEMSQTQLPTNAMMEKQINDIAKQMDNQQLAMQKMQQLPQAQQMAQQNPQAAQQLVQQGQQLLQSGQEAINKIMAKPTLDQVVGVLKDSRTRNFVLDIETDSTIIPNETQEKQARTEFIGVLSQLLPQLTQMIMADAQTAPFCGEVLKFATAPFRAGRSLDGAIDELVEQMKAKADQPRPDDPTTAQNKTALQIEQMKDQTNKQKIKAESDLEAQKLQQQDAHKKLELQNQKDIKAMELNAHQGDAQAKMVVQNQKAQESREAHQADMLGKDQDMALARQKADLAAEAHANKQIDIQNRARERQAAAQFRMTNPAPQGRVMP
jgi:hypothetical protein